MSDKILLCAECGTKNRVLSEKQGQRASCAVCHATLLMSAANKASSHWKHAAVASLLFCFVIIASSQLSGPPHAVNKTVTVSDFDKVLQNTIAGASGNKANNNHSSVALLPIPIETGIVNITTSAERVAPLEIKTRPGANYYLKIVDLRNVEVLTLYVHGGDAMEIDVPLGSYEIRYASGQTWYGEQSLFGPNTTYSKADSVFYFGDDGYRISGYTVELIPQIDGNLRTHIISPQSF